MKRFDENAFKARVNAALQRVKTLLENDRTPQLPSDVPHQYVDKYALVEHVGNAAIAAQLQVLEALGLTSSRLATLKDWAGQRSVSLRFSAEEQCHYLRKEEREVESATKSVTTSTLFGTSKSFTVTKITEYFYGFDVSYRLLAFEGASAESNIVLQGRVPVLPKDNLPPTRTDERHKHELTLTDSPYGENGYICDGCRLTGVTKLSYSCKKVRPP